MVLHRKDGALEHRRFAEIIDFLHQGDGLVINNTRVIPARIFGRKKTGGRVEILLVRPVDSEGRPIPPLFKGWDRQKDLSTWTCLIRDSKGLRPGSRIYFPGNVCAEVIPSSYRNRHCLRFLDCKQILEVLDRIGETPLPPYIKRAGENLAEGIHRRRYQSVFARRSGSIAAPTAGLHFSRQLLKALQDKGVEIFSITLQVGIGTFLPVRSQEVEAHHMEGEYLEISPRVATALNRLKEKGRRICAVGTTTVRAIESVAHSERGIVSKKGDTELFIYPGYTFKAVDLMVTNFHLPKSTLIMLVCAFAGTKRVKAAYAEAIKRGYRFYSYGDAMLIL
jgi:S-adenosylmethionine:tRNA ribosyltransferase-isomerase